jgi:hypothetical protein
MDVRLFTPDLKNIRAWFDVPKRYYERNKQMVEACDTSDMENFHFQLITFIKQDNLNWNSENRYD